MLNTTPIRKQNDPTTKYATPKKGFLPPIKLTVEKTIDLVPPYGRTG
jgi:hypothetical protein